MMTPVAGAAVRPLRLAWPPWQPPPGDGVVAVVTDAEPATGWADALLARVDQRRYLWVASGAPEASGLEILSRPGVMAATVAFDGVDARHLGLALDVACRARALRGTGGAGGCLTGWLPPSPPLAAVRVPHLVTVWHGTLAVDSVVWEILSVPAARRWLGSPLPDLSFVEANLDRLVRLRTAARTASLPPTAAAARLLSLLGPESDLPISLVYQRPDLFRALLRPGRTNSY